MNVIYSFTRNLCVSQKRVEKKLVSILALCASLKWVEVYNNHIYHTQASAKVRSVSALYQSENNTYAPNLYIPHCCLASCLPGCAYN